VTVFFPDQEIRIAMYHGDFGGLLVLTLNVRVLRIAGIFASSVTAIKICCCNNETSKQDRFLCIQSFSLKSEEIIQKKLL
jgi:hypothetical protein